MKLNMDCFNATLLYLENTLKVQANSFGGKGFIQPVNVNDVYLASQLSDFSKDDIFYALKKLDDEEFIDAKISKDAQGGWIGGNIEDITLRGHGYLASITSPTEQ